jgi:RimJ/RimL family protein N-acetyltransferase
MIAHMKTRGRSPVWGSAVSNIPSMRLAEKLGFVPVDRLIVFRNNARAA